MRYVGGGGRETIVVQKARFRSAGNSWKANENENVPMFFSAENEKNSSVESSSSSRNSSSFPSREKLAQIGLIPSSSSLCPLYLKNRAMAD